MTEKLALHGGSPVRTDPFPAWPVFDGQEESALKRVLESGKWGKQEGSEAATFEAAFAAYHEAAHGITVVNGTVALRIALLAAGIQAGDEVIVPPYTFLATASAVVEANGVPVFADLELDTFNLDPNAVEAAVTEKTRAIIPVHFAGLPVDMDAIMAIAKRHDLVVIEDACHAHGASYKNWRVGALGHMGVFSFQSSKNMTSGEGGIILTNDDELARLCRSIHNCGRQEGRMWYEHFRIGGNYRLGEFQAAILNAQWTRFEAQAETRERNGLYLAEKVEDIPGLIPQVRTADCTRHAYHLFAFRIDADAFGAPREKFLEALVAEGIPAIAGYAMPLYRQRLFLDRVFGPYSGALHPDADGRAFSFANVSCPNCEAICSAQGVWLTHNMLLGSQEDMDDIVQACRKVYDHRAELAKD